MELKFAKQEFQPKIQLYYLRFDQHKSNVELKKKKKKHMELKFSKLEFQLGKFFTTLEIESSKLEFQVGKIF